MMKVKIRTVFASITMLVIASTTLAQTGGGYDLTWNTYDGGGGTSTGVDFELTGTVGQPDAGEPALTGGNFSIRGGFWPGVSCGPDIPADYNGDCDVDHADYQSWEACASGPAVPYVGECSDTDFDNDLDTDQDDFATTPYKNSVRSEIRNMHAQRVRINVADASCPIPVSLNAAVFYLEDTILAVRPRCWPRRLPEVSYQRSTQ